MEASVVPDSIIESANRTLSNLEELKTNLFHFLSLSEPQVLSQMPPLQRAQAFLVLAKALSALFTCTITPFQLLFIFNISRFCSVVYALL